MLGAMLVTGAPRESFLPAGSAAGFPTKGVVEFAVKKRKVLLLLVPRHGGISKPGLTVSYDSVDFHQMQGPRNPWQPHKFKARAKHVRCVAFGGPFQSGRAPSAGPGHDL